MSLIITAKVAIDTCTIVTDAQSLGTIAHCSAIVTGVIIMCIIRTKNEGTIKQNGKSLVLQKIWTTLILLISSTEDVIAMNLFSLD